MAKRGAMTFGLTRQHNYQERRPARIVHAPPCCFVRTHRSPFRARALLAPLLLLGGGREECAGGVRRPSEGGRRPPPRKLGGGREEYAAGVRRPPEGGRSPPPRNNGSAASASAERGVARGDLQSARDRAHLELRIDERRQFRARRVLHAGRVRNVRGPRAG